MLDLSLMRVKGFNAKLISKNEKEEIYKRNLEFDNEYIVVVKDEEIGKKIYNFIKGFKGQNLWLSLMYFRITRYSATINKRVKWFCISNISLFNCLQKSSKKENLYTILTFIENVSSYGWNIDASRFDKYRLFNISEFFSFFIQSISEATEIAAKGCLIEYVHCALSGNDNLKEYYDKLLAEKVFYEEKELPYKMRVVKMCYKYYKDGTVPESISDMLIENAGEVLDLITSSEKIKSELNVTEETEEYTVYDGNIKLFKDIPGSFSKFVKHIAWYKHLNYSVEKPETLIRDFSNRVIGYKYITTEPVQSILDVTVDCQTELNNIFYKLTSFFEETKGIAEDIIYSEEYEYDFGKSICCIPNIKKSKIKILFNSLWDYYKIMSLSDERKKECIIKIYFSLFARYLNQKYGELNRQEQIRELPEVKYLSPIFVRELINFVLNKEVNYSKINAELFIMMKKYLKQYEIGEKIYYYDSRYCYSPAATTITFDYEIEKKHGAEVVRLIKSSFMYLKGKGNTKTYILPDGRRMVIFKTSKKIEAFKNEIENRKLEITKALGDISDEHVRFVYVSEILVNTNRLNNEDMYNISGYITRPLKGTPLSFEKFLEFDNKKLLKIVGYLFDKFVNKYIPWEHIWMDEGFNFLIDYLDTKFTLKVSDNSHRNSLHFINWMFNKLQEVGYNSLAFLDYYEFLKSRSYVSGHLIVGLANSYDTYCEEHKIFYSSERGKQCPACSRLKFVVPEDYETSLTKVFEDEVATHYSMDEIYNLKIYKPNCEHLHEVEKSVEEIIICNMQSTHRVNKIQDCFIPCKRAINSNNEFIGIVYEAVKFEAVDGNTKDVCVDLKNINSLNNLARLKSLLRFMLQVDTLLNRYKAFITDVFTCVFLNPSHKKQVQILNIEFLNIKDTTVRHPFRENTKNYASKYVQEVLKVDSSLSELFTTEEPLKFEALIEELKKLESKLTKYCPVHKQFYFNEYISCPRCISPELQRPYIEYKNIADFNSSLVMNEGGESFIYEYDGLSVVKVFKEAEVNFDLKSAVLSRILCKKDILVSINAQENKYKYIIPKKFFIDTRSKRLFGYSMYKVRNAFPISILKDKVEVEKLGFSKKDIFEIIITVGEGIETLHEKANIYIGDLNGRNILFDRDKNVYFLDFDGMGVDEIAPEFCTDGYIDPVSKKNKKITMKDDWYSYAIQAFYYLTYTHPFNGIYYEKVGKQRVLLEIPDKMERRISLLGNHGMKPPEIALDWNTWMSTELRDVFLRIFESDCRENIVPYLKEQCKKLGEKADVDAANKITRINSKFIAIEVESLDKDVVEKFRDYIKLSGETDIAYLRFLINTRLPQNKFVKSIENNAPSYGTRKLLISEDREVCYIIERITGIIAINIITGETLFSEDSKTLHFSNRTKFVMDGSTLYYNGKVNSQAAIFKLTVSPNGEVKKETIKLEMQDVRYFDVKFGTKFILINEAGSDLDEVYCNSEKFCEIKYDVSRAKNPWKYRILYDTVTKSWAIINNFKHIIIIKANGEKIDFISKELKNDEKLNSVVFYNGHLYIPSKDSLDIINVKTQKAKKLDCINIMNADSIICAINSQGFSVITDNILYKVQKDDEKEEN